MKYKAAICECLRLPKFDPSRRVRVRASVLREALSELQSFARMV